MENGCKLFLFVPADYNPVSFISDALSLMFLDDCTYLLKHVKDTVLVSVFGVLLHPLQMLLVTLQTPGVVFDLRCHVSFLQAVVQHLCFILTITAEMNQRVV